MQLRLELAETPSSLVIEPGLNDDAFEKLCAANPVLRLERTKEGAIVLNPPAAWGTGKANSELLRQLTAWWHTHRRGEVADSSAGIFLPDGSALSPNAAYITAEQEATLDAEDHQHFLPLVPAFIIELRSRSDSMHALQTKMETWMGNGAQLGWLVDPASRSVWVYEAGRAPRLETGPMLEGTGPVAGFTLDLNSVWSRYKRT